MTSPREQELKDEVLWLLIEAGADLSQFQTILHKTLQGENPSLERVKLLVTNGAPIDALDYEGYSPLDIAFSNCVDIEVIWALIEVGADIVETSDLLHRVLRNPSVESVHVEMLTNMGVALNTKDYMWSTPLEIAVERDLSPEIFRVLVDAGAHWASYPKHCARQTQADVAILTDTDIDAIPLLVTGTAGIFRRLETTAH